MAHTTYPSADPVGDRDFGSNAAYDIAGDLVFFMVTLMDVDPDGYSVNTTEGVLRARYRHSFEKPKALESNRVYNLEIELRDVAYTFQSGHRIRLDMTSSNFPKQDQNPNNMISAAKATEEDMQTATQTLYLSSEYPS